MTGFICSNRRYLYQGVTIEVPGIGGPCVVKVNGDPYWRLTKKQAATLLEFCNLPNDESEKYRSGGGCVPI